VKRFEKKSVEHSRKLAVKRYFLLLLDFLHMIDYTLKAYHPLPEGVSKKHDVTTDNRWFSKDPWGINRTS
jgi:hypothetical protein